MPDTATRLLRVTERIRAAEAAYGRQANSVELLAVSKRQPLKALCEAYQAGQRAFGENYLQEAAEKQSALTETAIEWHLIGGLQSNKTREAAANFDWIHTIDRLKIAQRLSAQRPAGLAPLNICLQVNISAEPQKAGCIPDEVVAFGMSLAELPNLRLRGLMAIPEPADEFTAQRRPFARLRQLFEQLQDQGLGVDTLSMGMSGDLEAAVAEGATYVRIGTAIFGPRTTKQEDS